VYDWTGDRRLALLGLLHDAPEAFLPDMPKPAKALLPDYRTLEARLWEAVCTKLDIPLEVPEVVHEADVHILAYEGGAMFPNTSNRWWLQYGNPTNPKYAIECWNPNVAYTMFKQYWYFYND
jgi:hypothetical protein